MPPDSPGCNPESSTCYDEPGERASTANPWATRLPSPQQTSETSRIKWFFPSSPTRPGASAFRSSFYARSSRTDPATAQDPPPQFSDLATRAASARDQQNLPLAIQLYTQAEQINPSWQEGWWYLGVLQYSSNQYSGAIDAFSHLLQLAPTAVPAMALRGLSEFETGAYDEALRDLDQAVAHGAANEPRNEQIIRYHLALLLAHAARFEDALAQYTALARLHAEAPDLFIAIGLAGTRSTAFPADVPAADRAFYESAGHAGYVFLSGDDEEADRLFTELFRAESSPSRACTSTTATCSFRMTPQWLGISFARSLH